ncbi:RHS repeat-associated core domain-containing protein [Ohtaekwangia koreensis]|uniref:RHS repeat-associated core domain-containing protein n=1 Tax=Ohtaekwangia koreensis TaxID=688867 RepID=A0A1T5MAD7_9BACT|nr:RHS repeat-associated core domain-containing protein [Ohtaekwangia koreensis]SKC85190.1 RHS repeat-associated core domain-containing protein [Ohtaekwangia koreensis]
MRLIIYRLILLLMLSVFLHPISACGQSGALQDVSWTDGVGVTISGNSITKIAASGWGNAGAASVNRLPNNADGTIEYIITSLNRGQFVFGLSDVNSDNQFYHIDYSFHLTSTALSYIRLNGTSVLSFNVALGDVLRIKRIGTDIVFERNNDEIYTANNALQSSLIADVSMYSNAGYVNDLKVSFGGPLTVTPTWSNQIGITFANNTLTKTASSGYGNAWVTSTEILAAGADGWAEFKLDAFNEEKAFGLLDQNLDNSYTSIDFGFLTFGTNVYIYENGTNMATVSSPQLNDVFRVERIGSTIYWKRNGITVYMEADSYQGALQMFATIKTTGAKIVNPTVTFLIAADEPVVEPTPEFLALRTFYDSLGGVNWTNQYNWPPVSNWPMNLYGASEEDGYINTVIMEGNNLEGKIPLAFWKLKDLWIARLSANKITGFAPFTASDVADVASFYEVNLSDNKIRSLPHAWGSLSGLQYVVLNGNSLSSLPSSFGSLSNLALLELSGNEFSSFPSAISENNFPVLYRLNISDNALTSLPDLSNVSSYGDFVDLDVSNNYLDFTSLEPLVTSSNIAPVYTPQKAIPTDDMSVTPGLTLVITARPKGQHSTVTWEKQQSNGSWQDITSQNEDASGQTFKKTAVSSADIGIYRWKMTNTIVTGLVLESEPIKVQALDTPPASNHTVKPLYNGLITAVSWRTDEAHETGKGDYTGMYLYEYDDKYQIKEANWAVANHTLNTFTMSDNMFRLTGMSYDPNGNIRTLKRYDKDGNRVHDFTYAYESNTNRLQNVTGYVNAYTYDALGQMIGEDKVEEESDQYATYDVSGKVTAVYSDAGKTVKKIEYLYDDRGFRLAKVVYPQGSSGEIRTTWYIRDASGSVLSIYEQEGAPSELNDNPLVQTEVPIYGSGKIGTYYATQDGSVNYEITDHLGNVRALVRENVLTYTATLEDNLGNDITNPRRQEELYFRNIDTAVDDNERMNHTPSIPGVVDNPNKSSLLHWIDGMTGQGAAEKSIGPSIALRVKAGDTLRAEVWSRFQISTSNTSIPVATFASLVAGAYTGAAGLEGVSAAQSGQTFGNALAGIFTGSDDERPFAHLNYVLLNNSLQNIGSLSVQVPEEAGFEVGEESIGEPVMLSLPGPIVVTEDGYVYIWVSNASENRWVWFDDLKVTHSSPVFVAQATDYGVWGDILREQKTDESIYRYGYQGQFSERDLETGWSHFELREYDPVIGRWLSVDPEREHWSPFVGMANDPINCVDPDGGTVKWKPGGIKEPKSWWARLTNTLTGYGFLNKAYKLSQQGYEVFYEGSTGTSAAYVKYELYSYLLTSEDETEFAWIHDVSEYQLIGRDPGPPTGEIMVGLSPLGSVASKTISSTSTSYLRRLAVTRAWAQELELVKRLGRGTTNWTRKEMVELLKNGQIKGVIGHHIKNVKNFPQHAGNPNNIKFVRSTGEHLKLHRGSWRNKTTGNFINRQQIMKQGK